MSDSDLNTSFTHNSQAHHHQSRSTTLTAAEAREQLKLYNTANEAYIRKRPQPFPVEQGCANPPPEPVTHVPSSFAWKWNKVQIRGEIWEGWQWDVINREENMYPDLSKLDASKKASTTTESAKSLDVLETKHLTRGGSGADANGLGQISRSKTAKRKHVQVSSPASTHAPAKKQKTDLPPMDTASPDVYYPDLAPLPPSASPGASFSTSPDEAVPEVAELSLSTIPDEVVPEPTSPSEAETPLEEEPDVEEDAGFDPWGGFDEFRTRKWTEAPMSWKRATFPLRYPSSHVSGSETKPEAQIAGNGPAYVPEGHDAGSDL